MCEDDIENCGYLIRGVRVNGGHVYINRSHYDISVSIMSKEECDFLIYLYSKHDKWESLFHEVIIEEDINKTEISKINNNVEQKTALKQSIIDLLLKKQSKK